MKAALRHSPPLSVSYDERISSPSPTTPPPTQPRPMPSPSPENRLSMTPSPRFRTPRSITSDTSLAQSTPVSTSQSRHRPLARGACRRRRSSRQTPHFPVAQSSTSHRANHYYQAIANHYAMQLQYVQSHSLRQRQLLLLLLGYLSHVTQTPTNFGDPTDRQQRTRLGTTDVLPPGPYNWSDMPYYHFVTLLTHYYETLANVVPFAPFYDY